MLLAIVLVCFFWALVRARGLREDFDGLHLVGIYIAQHSFYIYFLWSWFLPNLHFIYVSIWAGASSLTLQGHRSAGLWRRERPPGAARRVAKKKV